MFGLGVAELILIGAIALLVFGPRQLPRMGKALGDTLRELRNIGKDVDAADQDDQRDSK